MAAELGFHYSFTNLAESSQKNQTRNRLNFDMPPQDVDDDSWEVRAFAEDTANVMGTTWPPRSYTCTYCRREFRSAQALGGHMNVHRRDRARLHQAQPKAAASTAASFIIPPPDFISNGGLCLLYQFPDPNDGGINIQSPSALLSLSHRSLNNFISSSSPPMFFPANDPPAGSAAFSQLSYSQADQQVSDEQVSAPIENGGLELQELDLELRLGHGPSAGAAAEKKEKICDMEAACLRKRSN